MRHFTSKGKAPVLLSGLLALSLILSVPLSHASSYYDFSTRSTYDALDAGYNGGNGFMQPNDEEFASLSWAEGPILASYVSMFESYGDADYLDRFIQQADQVLDLRDTVRGKVDYRGLSLPNWPAGTRFTTGKLILEDTAGAPTLEVTSAFLGDTSENTLKISAGTAPDTFKMDVYTGVRTIAAGGYHTMTNQSTNLVWNAGDNSYGQIGFGSGNHLQPVPAQGLANSGGLATGIKQVKGGEYHSAALMSAGTVWTWGLNGFGQLGDGTTANRAEAVRVSVLENITAISAGLYHTLALDSEGSVWAWGYNNYGQLGDGTTVNRVSPIQVSGLDNVVEIAGGGYFSLALKADGTVWAWGVNNVGQLGDGTSTNRAVPVQVGSLSDIIGIAAGGAHGLALKPDGTVQAWGYNSNGQLGDGTTANRLSPVAVSGLAGVKRLGAGGYHSLAIDTGGTAWAWGMNQSGQLGDGTMADRHAPVQVAGLPGVTDIDGGIGHTVALTSDFIAWAWGGNTQGQLGVNSTLSSATPVKIINNGRKQSYDNLNMNPLSPNYAPTRLREQFHCGFDGTSSGITAKDLNSGTALPDRNPVASVGNFEPQRYAFPVLTGLLAYPLAAFARVVYGTPALDSDPYYKGKADLYLQAAVDAMATHEDEFVDEGNGEGGYVYRKGAAMYMDGAENPYNHMVLAGKALIELAQIPGTHQAGALDKATKMATKLKNDLQYNANLDTYTWTYYPTTSSGYQGWDERSLGVGIRNHENTPCWPAYDHPSRLSYGSIELDFVSLAYDNGIVFNEQDMARFAKTFERQLLFYENGKPRLHPEIDGTGIPIRSFELFTAQWNKVAIWNPRIFQNLMNIYSSELFDPAATFAAPRSAYFNEYRKLIERKSKLWAVGENSYGQLGDGTTVDRTSGVALDLQSAVEASAGEYHSLALTSDRQVWSWGLNNFGQLGDGTAIDSSVPLQVSALSNVISVKAGAYHSLALKADGTVWSWGYNNSGQLGDGTSVNCSTPIQVSGLDNVVAIAAGGFYSLALKGDGTVWSWGYNNVGQLGDGSTINRSVPIQVSGINQVMQLAAGGAHSLVLKQDGTVWAWGYNANGQLGDGTFVNHSTAQQVPGIAQVTALAAGGYHSLALQSNGTAYAWGLNDNGQLGDGTLITRSAPAAINGLVAIKHIGAGLYHSLAVQYESGAVWAWGDNSRGQLADGTNVDRSMPVQVPGSGGLMSADGGGYHTIIHELSR